jgi:hypothetical protein
MSGHLFVVHADLSALYCDHWLLPVDRGLSASRSWNRTPAWRQIRDHLPNVMAENQRVVAVDWEGPRRPWPTDVASGRRIPPDWLAESVRQFLEAAAAAPPTLPSRDRPLLALPVVGTGYGGKRRWAGEVLRCVVPEIYAFLADHDVDVALVTWTEEDFAAAQAARRAAARDGACVWPDELRPELRVHAEKLAALASQQRLVVFMGAGVSASAGLPTWSQLLDDLAAEAGFTEAERRGLEALTPLDRAQLVAKRLGPRPDDVGQAIQRRLDCGGAVALSHGLVAGLPVREFITTNYDDCFERACAAIHRDVARLPYVPASGAHRWLLKMHGCVSVPADIVLTWEDYARYAQRSAALAGIVQAMLMTKHMLFVGFSLDDENFRRIVDDVRRALAGAPRERLGSVVALFSNPLVEQLWGDDLQWLALEPGSRPPADAERAAVAAAARRFELFLDCLSFLATPPHHLLNPRFSAVLTPEEQALREALEPVRAWVQRRSRPDAEEPVAAAWALLGALLWELGDREPGAGG